MFWTTLVELAFVVTKALACLKAAEEGLGGPVNVLSLITDGTTAKPKHADRILFNFPIYFSKKVNSRLFERVIVFS